LVYIVQLLPSYHPATNHVPHSLQYLVRLDDYIVVFSNVSLSTAGVMKTLMDIQSVFPLQFKIPDYTAGSPHVNLQLLSRPHTFLK